MDPAAADFQDARATGDFPMEEIESLAALQVLAGLADSDPEAARLVTEIVTLARPLAALHEPPWPERIGRTTV